MFFLVFHLTREHSSKNLVITCKLDFLMPVFLKQGLWLRWWMCILWYLMPPNPISYFFLNHAVSVWPQYFHICIQLCLPYIQVFLRRNRIYGGPTLFFFFFFLSSPLRSWLNKDMISKGRSLNAATCTLPIKPYLWLLFNLKHLKVITIIYGIFFLEWFKMT